MKKILVLNGPNLDMLGVREPDVYGSNTLGDLERQVADYGARRGVEVSCAQSNSEAELIEAIHASPGRYDGIVYNPGAHTHYSYALHDCIEGVPVPVVEVHISDISAREEFRRTSVLVDACIGQVAGLGADSYLRGVDLLLEHLR